MKGDMMNRQLISIFFILIAQVALANAGNITAKFIDLNSASPIADVNVNVYDADNILVSQVQSLNDGTILITGLDGVYTLRTFKQGYDNGYFTAQVNADDQTDFSNLPLVPKASLHVNVYDNSNNPISDGVVKVIQNGNVVVAEFRGSSGDITLSAGTYDAIFSAPFHSSDMFSITLLPGDSQVLTSSLQPSPIDLTPVVVDVRVELSSSSITAGDEISVKSIATYNDAHEEDVTAVSQWDAGGSGTLILPKLIATVYGSHDITATYGGESGSAALSVALGRVESFDLQSSSTSIYTDESASLTSYLVDIYGNLEATSDVAYSTTCGSVQGPVFRSSSACTATITSTYNPDNSLTDNIAITVSARSSSSSSSSSGGYQSSSSSGGSSSSSSSSTSDEQASDDAAQSSGGGHTDASEDDNVELAVKFVFPPSAYVGDKVTVIALDANSDPMQGMVITVERPDGKTISLVTNDEGEASFVPGFEGEYILGSSKYVVLGERSIYVNAVPSADLSQVNGNSAEGNNENQSSSASGSETSPSDDDGGRSILDTIFAAFAGEMSIADALRTTLPLWLIIAAVLFAAAVFFVVYTFFVGREAVKRSAPDEPSDEEVAVVEQLAQKPAGDDAAVSGNGDAEHDLSEKEMIRRELEEKMRRQKQIKDDE